MGRLMWFHFFNKKEERSMKKLFFSVMALLATSGMVMGASFAVPAVTEALPDTVIEVPISVEGEAALEGINLYLEVGLPLEILAVSFDAGTIFDGNNTGKSPYDLMGNMAAASTTTQSGSVATPGVVAIMSVAVPAETPEADYVVRTYIPDYGVGSDLAGEAFDGQGEGVIRVIPEPATALLLIGAIPFLRRRRA